MQVIRRAVFVVLVSTIMSAFTIAAAPALSKEEQAAVDKFEKSLNYKTGMITIGDNLATANLGTNYRFLGPEDTEKVLTTAWGNPPDNHALGMIVPAKTSVLSSDSWGVVIKYNDDGHVSDKDAESIDYNEMLKEIQAAQKEHADELRKKGYPVMNLTGWARAPHYDQANRKLHWAKDLSVEGENEHTLNYDIRMLGRQGVLSMNAVGSMSQVNEIDRDLQGVIKLVNFNPGNRYEDYKEGSDKLAAYGIGALVAGGVAAKAGLFKGLIALLIASKKLIIVGVIALAALVKKIFSSRAAAR